jgi:hypothetical protein
MDLSDFCLFWSKTNLHITCMQFACKTCIVCFIQNDWVVQVFVRILQNAKLKGFHSYHAIIFIVNEATKS